MTISIVAVDLASKYSAACWMTNRHVLEQWDSWQKTETEFIDKITSPWYNPRWLEARVPPSVLMIEDLPHRVPYMTITKNVCRLQGRIVERMHSYGSLSSVLFVPPSEWRRYFHLKNGGGNEATVATAASNGYEPPNLRSRAGKGENGIARKVQGDYCAAYLIGRWALEMHLFRGTFEGPRVSRYDKI